MVVKPFALPGLEITTPHGPTWCLRHRYTGQDRHGAYRLESWHTIPDDLYQRVSGVAPGARPVFLDTETTGLAGGAGTFAFLIGLGVWEDDGLTLELIFLRTPEEEAAALAYVEQRLASASALVTFNGLGFDVPVLENRCLLNRVSASWRSLPHLDLLPVARMLWRDHLPSRRLGALEEALLDVQRTVEDVPSWLIPQLYRDYLRWGHASLIQPVLYHNRIDVLSLVTLLACAGERLARPESLTLSAAEWAGLGRLWARAGDPERARQAWLRALEADLPPEQAAALWRGLATERKQAGDWEQACALWQAWAERDPWTLEPLIELAKYCEWHVYDYAKAIHWTRQALERAQRLPGGGASLATRAELQQRLQRLLRKATSSVSMEVGTDRPKAGGTEHRGF